MKKVMNFNLSRLRKGEHFNFHETVLRAFTPELAVRYQLTAQRDIYQKHFLLMQSVFAWHRRSEYSDSLRVSDGERDGFFLMLKKRAQIGRLDPERVMREAAVQLSGAFLSVEYAYRKSYVEDSAEVEKLVQRLRSEEYCEAVERLGLSHVVDALDEANRRTMELVKLRAEERYARMEKPKLKVVRPDVDSAFRDCAAALDALFMVNELTARDESVRREIGGLIDGINAAANQHKEILQIRVTKANNKTKG